MNDNEKANSRTIFVLDSARWDEFMEALNAPARAVPQLQRLFREASPFDTPKAE